MSKISHLQVSQNNGQNGTPIWVILYDKVYDVSNFLTEHPGGKKAILRYAGQDATEAFDPIHPKRTLENQLALNDGTLTLLGELDQDSEPQPNDPTPVSATTKETITLPECLNLDDFEFAAEKILTPIGKWELYQPAKLTPTDIDVRMGRIRARDGIVTTVPSSDSTFVHYNDLILRPRVLVDVSRFNLSATYLSTRKMQHLSNQAFQATFPAFVAPFSHNVEEFQRDLNGNVLTELELIDQVLKAGIPYIVSTKSKLAPSQLSAFANKSYSKPATIFWELPSTNPFSTEFIKTLHKAGVRGLCLSLISPTPSSHSQFLLPDLKSLIQLTRSLGLVLLVRGIKTWEDAQLASSLGVDVIYLSHTSSSFLKSEVHPHAIHPSSPLEVLLEIRKNSPNILRETEVWIGGGIRRGTDILKALCLGAKMVGIGSGFLYSTVFGAAGFNAAFDVIMDEYRMNLQLLGAQSSTELSSDLVNSRGVTRWIVQNNTLAKL